MQGPPSNIMNFKTVIAGQWIKHGALLSRGPCVSTEATWPQSQPYTHVLANKNHGGEARWIRWVVQIKKQIFFFIMVRTLSLDLE